MQRWSAWILKHVQDDEMRMSANDHLLPFLPHYNFLKPAIDRQVDMGVFRRMAMDLIFVLLVYAPFIIAALIGASLLWIGVRTAIEIAKYMNGKK
jgi:hypothetical protein